MEKVKMNQLVHKFLADDERAKTILASVGTGMGLILLAVAVFATFILR